MTATAPPDVPGVLAERYQLGEVLGRGGMADVYRAQDVVLQRPVAVKLLRDVSDPGKRERFVAEARTLALLNHPGLVTVLDAGIDDERPFLVMSLAEGRTLAQRLEEGPLPSEEVRAIGHQLALSLQYAHDQGVIHRDVKPSNVLLTDDGALLVDFGIARLIGSTDQHTRTGDTIGSPPYLAPEQVAGEEITEKADLYSFGLVLLEALTGVRAYLGSPLEAAVARLSVDPAIPTSLEPAWRDLLGRMTDRQPGRRPTAAEVADMLGGVPVAAAAGVSVASPVLDEQTATLAVSDLVPDAPAPTTAPARRRRRSWIAASLALLLAVLVAGAVLWSQSRPEAALATETSLEIPDGVPAAMRPSLIALHRAVAAVEDRVPELGKQLARVDSALSGGRLPAAEKALTALVSAAQDARSDAVLTAAETDRILKPARRLMALIPGPEVEPDPAPAPSGGTRKTPPRSEPTRQPTTAESPQPTTEPTAGTDPDPPPPTPEPTPEPTDSATKVATPAAAGATPAAG